jgi:hypothetical protein
MEQVIVGAMNLNIFEVQPASSRKDILVGL